MIDYIIQTRNLLKNSIIEMRNFTTSCIFINIIPSFLLLLLSTSCSPPQTSFKSDEKNLLNFKNNKSEIFSIMEKCYPEKNKSYNKPYAWSPFYLCKISLSQLQKSNILEISEKRNIKTYSSPSQYVKNNSFLIVTDQYIDNTIGTYVDEKGYIFSPTPINHDLIKEGSLDQFRNKELKKQDSTGEKWKFKQIEPNWYLYYRQFYQTFLH